MLAQGVDYTAVDKNLLEIIKALVVVKVDAAHNLKQPVGFDNKDTVVVADRNGVILKVLDSENRCGFSLISGNRRKL